MRKLTLIICLVIFFPSFSQDVFFEKADQFFTTYVNGGLVDYAKIRENESDISELKDLIKIYNLDTASQDRKKAFLINAYNLLVVEQILGFYPLTSPKEIPGFFDMVGFTVAGEITTLDGLENNLLLAEFPDARLHFMLVCAANGCPPIANYAYLPFELEEQLVARTEEILGINWYIRVNKDKVAISKVFDWYQDHFLDEAESVLSFINKYRLLKIPADHPIEYYEYDWTLNDAERGSRY